MLIKTCNSCFEDLPKTLDFFYKKFKDKNSLRSICKKCTKKINKKYYRNNHPNIAKNVKKWKEKHPVEDLKYKRDYYHNKKNYSVINTVNEKSNKNEQ